MASVQRPCRLIPSIALCASLAVGCAYQRHTTLLSPVPKTASDQAAQKDKPPGGMYSVRVLNAQTPPRKLSGLPWDEDGSPPDPFVRLYVDGRMVWQSEPAADQPAPQWDTALPRNVVIPSRSRFRLELWDYDSEVSADPMGHIESVGLPPAARRGATARISLGAYALVRMQVDYPTAHRGLGVSVEIHEDYLEVIDVEQFSPAKRAGISVGDHIVGIGNERVAHMNADDAATELSLAVDRKHKLAVSGPEGRDERQLELDSGYVWLVM